MKSSLFVSLFERQNSLKNPFSKRKCSQIRECQRLVYRRLFDIISAWIKMSNIDQSQKNPHKTKGSSIK